MSAAITRVQPQEDAAIVERVLLVGDLSRLTAEERVAYYMAVCRSVGLNPLTRPFEYISLNGKLTLYAVKNATDQLRQIRGISVDRLERSRDGDIAVVIAHATDKNGREDEDVGAVDVKGLSGEKLANATMKAVTKAKRRVTLSICGLSFLDESEVESVPGAKKVRVDAQGEIVGESVEPFAPRAKWFKPAPSSPVVAVPADADSLIPALEASIAMASNKKMARHVRESIRTAWEDGRITREEKLHLYESVDGRAPGLPEDEP